MIGIARETSVFRREGLSPSLSLLIPTFAFPQAPAVLAVRILRRWNAPLPVLFLILPRVFGGRLDTRLLSTPCPSTGELLRTL